MAVGVGMPEDPAKRPDEGAPERQSPQIGAAKSSQSFRWRREAEIYDVPLQQAVRDPEAREQLFSAMRYNQEVFAARARTTAQLFFRATNLTLLLSLAAFGWALALYGQSRQLYVALLETPSEPFELLSIVLSAMLFSALAFFLYRDFTKLDALALRSDGRLSDPPEIVLVIRSVAAVSLGAAVWGALMFGLLTAMADLTDIQRLVDASGLITASSPEFAGPAQPDQIYQTLNRGVSLTVGLAVIAVPWILLLWMVREWRNGKFLIYAAGALTAALTFSDDVSGWMGGVATPEMLAGFWTAVGPLATTLIAATALLALLAACFGVAARWIGVPPLILALALYVLYRIDGPTLLKSVLIFGALAYLIQLCRPAYVGVIRMTALVLAIAASLAIDEIFPPPQRAATQIDEQRLSMEDAFEKWAKARWELGDGQAFGEKPYPVFVFAAQGGGMYAAAASSLFMARMQDRCPHFAQHVFAISGVSGGAVGASFFNALINARPPAGRDLLRSASCLETPSVSGPNEQPSNEQPTNEQLMARLVTGAFAAPVIAGLARDKLFPLNMLFREPETGDRAQRLKSAMIAAAAAAAADDRVEAEDRVKVDEKLTEPFSEHWLAERAAPALALNVTRPLDGARVVFAPFDDFGRDIRFRTLEELAQLSLRDEQVACLPETGLLEAALASARFPYVLPEFQSQALFLNEADKPDSADGDCDPTRNEQSIVYAFVDGGYVDASGARTAVEVYNVIARVVAKAERAAQTQTSGAEGADEEADELTQFIARIRPHVVLLTTDTGVDDEVRALLSQENDDEVRALLSQEIAAAARKDAYASDAEDFSARETDLGEISEAAPFDIIAPIQALLNVRKLRAANAVADARNDIGRGDWVGQVSAFDRARAAAASPNVADADLDPQKGGYASGEAYALEIVPINVASFHIPLAWRLSETARDVLSAFVGHPEECAQGRPEWEDLDPRALERLEVVDQMLALQVARRVRQNDCAAQRLVTSLSPNRGPR